MHHNTSACREQRSNSSPPCLLALFILLHPHALPRSLSQNCTEAARLNTTRDLRMRRKTLDLDAHPGSMNPKKHRPTWPEQDAPASCRFGRNNCHDNVSTVTLHTLEQSVKLLKALFTRQRLDLSRFKQSGFKHLTSCDTNHGH